MAETFNNASVKLTSANATDSYQAPNSSGNRAIVLSCLVANVDGTNNAEITLWIANSSDTQLSILANTIVVPADASIELIPNKVVLTQGQKLRAQANNANDLHVTVSVLEIT
jgi:hypothetical protein